VEAHRVDPWFAITATRKVTSAAIAQSLERKGEWVVLLEAPEWGARVVRMEHQEEMAQAALFATIAISLDTWRATARCLERKGRQWFATIVVWKVISQGTAQSQGRSAE